MANRFLQQNKENQYNLSTATIITDNVCFARGKHCLLVVCLMICQPNLMIQLVQKWGGIINKDHLKSIIVYPVWLYEAIVITNNVIM